MPEEYSPESLYFWGLERASRAAATPYHYRDIDWVGKTLSRGGSVSGTLGLVDPYIEGECVLWICDKEGFVPGTAVGGRISFLIVGANLVDTEVSIDLTGPQAFEDPSFESYGFWIFNLEVAQIEGEVLAALNADPGGGWLDWEISLTGGAAIASAGGGSGEHRHHSGCGHYDEFFVKTAMLEAAIPEPNAALLFALGAGVVGTGVRRRRRA